ncbi:MAG: ABC transporter ATP-binding protein [Breznakia sp.]
MSKETTNKHSENQKSNHRLGDHGQAPAQKAKDFKGTVKKLFTYLKPYRLHLLTVLIFAIASTVFVIVGPKILGQATTEIANGLMAKAKGEGGIDFDKIQDIMILLVGLYLTSSICAFLQSFVMTSISQRLAYNLRTDLMKKINRLPLSYFDKTSKGDVLSRVTNDIDTVSLNMNQSMSQAITAVVQVIGYLGMMIWISWMMTVVAMIVIPLSGIIIAIIASKSQKYFVQQQASLGKVNGHTEEMYGGHAVVKAFNGEKRSVDHFNLLNDELYGSAWKSQFLSGLMMPIAQFVGNIGYVLVCLVGGVLATHNSVTILGIVFTGVQVAIGDIQAFIQYGNLFNQQIAQASQLVNMMQATAAAGERVFEFLYETELSSDSSEAIDVFDDKGVGLLKSSVTFDNVRFGYTEDKIIIHGFSLRVGSGQKVAIVGPTGAGKTTIVKLLMRFYELNGGAIYVGDENIVDMKRSDLRKMFGMVLQDAWLFNGSVMENLRYAKPEANNEEVYEAAQAARVDHFVKTLEHGYETKLNEETNNVSQGQKQLLTIARAFLSDPKILILDEATSNVDTRTEVLIQEGMDNLMRGRTSFVIAHRLSTIRNADVIIVMDKGDIVEIGDHDELLEKAGFYAKLYNSQFEDGRE